MKRLKKPKGDDVSCSASTTSVKSIICPPRKSSTTSKSSSKTFLVPETQRYERKEFCGKLEGKTICEYVETFPPYKIDKPKECLSKPKERSYMKIFRDEFCLKEKPIPPCSTITPKSPTESCVCPAYQSPSIMRQEKLSKQKWKKPCKASDFDDKKDYFIGKCTKEQREVKPSKRQNWTPQFNITEDPRKTQCLRNPKRILKPQKPEERCKKISEQVYLADNIDTPSVSEESTSVCVEIDLDNPMELDFQGIDYQCTYLKDEQNIEDQKEYLKQKRHIDRGILRANIGALVFEEQHHEKVTTPKFFDIHKDYSCELDLSEKVVEEVKIPVSTEEVTELAKLFRTQDKPINRYITDEENHTRFGRYHGLFMSKLEKSEEEAIKQGEHDQIAAENLNFTIVDEDFDNLLSEKSIDIKAKFDSLPKIQRRKWYPHTLKETKYLRNKMKKSKRILRDKAIIRREFYKEKGLDKKVNEDDLIISDSTSTGVTLSEQSTDDEDDITVGPKKPEKYYLRGFHFKLGSEPRGKLHITQKREGGRAVRTCQTRSSWFESLALKGRTVPFNQYNVSTVVKEQSPDDPKLELFRPEHIPHRECNESPIKNFVTKPIGLQYKKTIAKTIKVKKPHYVKVKKFNLTGYLFGDTTDRDHSSTSSISLMSGKVMKEIHEYIHMKNKEKKQMRRRQRRQRMRHLGIPVKVQKKRKKLETCVDSKSEDSDWVPEQEKITSNEKVNVHLASKLTMYRSEHIRICTGPIVHINDTPAPEFREPVLRRHPRLGRRISAFSINNEKIKNYEIPVLEAPPDDAIIEKNLNERKTEYTTIFDARHHHDHLDPIQHKALNVKYTKKVPQAKTDSATAKQPKRRKPRPFEKAMPQGLEAWKFVDLSLPQIEPNEISIQQQKSYHKIYQNLTCGKGETYGISSSSPDHIFKSTNRVVKDFPNHQKYLNIIRDMTKEIKKRLANVEDTSEEFVIDKEAYRKELEDEWKSISSCVTSLESSICTNFTNDSGSYLLVQETKIPLDYVRKSLVPFEEIDRTRVKASIRQHRENYLQPYRIVPFAGQHKELRKSEKGDKFFTFNTRIRNSLRARLEVEPVDLKKTPLGTDKVKALAQVATDLDENYMSDLNQSMLKKNFRVKSSMALVKDALRKKYEVWNIQSQIVEQQIAEKKESQYAEDIIKLEKMLDHLFTKWEKKEYDKSKSKTRLVKMYYEATDIFKKELYKYEKEYTLLNMQIVFTEDDWIKRIRLQNFHYLLMKNSWREENDWIHQKEDGTLENYRESIENRKTANIRLRERDDAWAIREFYENHYLKNNHPIVIVFPDAESFNKAVQKLKIRTFVCLLELHYTIWMLINFENTYREHETWYNDFVATRSKFVNTKCAKKYFMEDRATKLKTIAMNLLGEPLHQSISSPRLQKIKSIGNVVYSRVVPENIRRNVKENLDIVQKMELVFQAIIDVLAKMDEYPKAVIRNAENKYRRKLKYDKRQSAQAYQIEKRIALTVDEIKRNMAPPFKKPKRTAKLRRLSLRKKQVITQPQVKRLSQKTLYFYKAFVPDDDDDERSLQEADEEMLAVNTNIQDTVIPFYFDHFLRLNNYEPNYNFKTQVELTYGPEEKPFRYKKVLPEVYQKMDTWEINKKKKMEADIRKTANLYTNVKL